MHETLHLYFDEIERRTALHRQSISDENRRQLQAGRQRILLLQSRPSRACRKRRQMKGNRQGRSQEFVTGGSKLPPKILTTFFFFFWSHSYCAFFFAFTRRASRLLEKIFMFTPDGGGQFSLLTSLSLQISFFFPWRGGTFSHDPPLWLRPWIW